MKHLLPAASLATAATLLVPAVAQAAPAPRFKIVKATNLRGEDEITKVIAAGRKSAWAFGTRGGYDSDALTSYRWNGRSWRSAALPRGVKGQYAGGAARGGSAWAAIDLDTNEDEAYPMAKPGLRRAAPDPDKYTGTVLAWSGGRWKVSWQRKRVLVGDVIAFGPKDVRVVAVDHSGAAPRPILLRFDGRRWSERSFPQLIVGIVAVSRTKMFGFGEVKGRQEILWFDGRRWRVLPMPKLPADTTITELTVSGGRLFVPAHVGNTGPAYTLLLRWDGRRWTKERPKIGAYWQMRSPVPDGKGGVYLLGDWRSDIGGQFPPKPYDLFHRDAKGRWTGLRNTARDVRMNSLTTIPGTRSVWGAGRDFDNFDVDGVIGLLGGAK